MATLNQLYLEQQRRAVILRPGTVLSDGTSLLGYDGDPNNANASNGEGEELLILIDIGCFYIQRDGTMWRKTVRDPSTWVPVGSGGGSSETKHIITRGAFEIDMAAGDGSGGPTFLTMQENSFAGDTLWDDVTYTHAMVLPYDTTVERVILRGTATNGATVEIGMHTNKDVTNTNSVDYKFFPLLAEETASATYTYNNESQVFTFAPEASANAGDTLGISVSSDQPIGMVNATIVLNYTP